MMAEVGQSFPKTHRLLKRGQFTQVMDEGGKAVDRNVVVLATENGTTQSRLGIVASRKAGNAVQRNRAKRLIRESFRRSQMFQGGVDVVVIVRKDAANATQMQISNSLTRCLTKIAQVPLK